MLLVTAILKVGIAHSPKPFISTIPYEYVNTTLVPQLETAELTGQYPIPADKPRSTGGTGLSLRYYDSKATLPEWHIAHFPVWPLKVNQSFSSRHSGIDLDCNYKEPIYAVNDGIVVFAKKGYNGGYGNFIILSHLGGFLTRYGHNTEIFVKEGQQVKAGQIIGSCGTTGHSTGTHTHFEVVYNNEFLNPVKYLK